MKSFNRRDFFKLAGSTAAVAGVASTGALALSGVANAATAKKDFSGNNAAYQGPMKSINVYSEDGKLREVLFGRVDNLILPEYDPIWDFAGEATVNMLKKHGGKLFSEANPEWFAKAHSQIENVVSFLESKGIVVHRPADHTNDMINNYNNMSVMNVDTYCRDGQVSVGNTLFETAFMTPERGRNKHAVRYVTMELMRNGTDIKSMPQPLDTYNHDHDLEPLIEGGDVMIDHGHIYVGNSGKASNELGIQWMRNAYPEWKVHEIKIKTDKFPHQHLDCLMNAFGDWGVILEEDIVGGIEGLPEPLRNKQWIPMTAEEAHLKLANFIAISPTELVMATEAKRLREAIKAARPELTIYDFPYYEVGKIGGSLRCNTQPIFREG
ncbi:hypothetical protein A3K86_02500 [Photobacterium jeanii]|uniref:Amidinotransferase n=1 Tax=Photobacterium jeanii TaxID=858640 RepID=A0A178KKG1_9GAMM|nr:hypothetical protein [Photobacterium jeanii]OAN17809.1 hypothetical protein A3K86_02500 [Photobacterium jeanii]PST92525.1 hypothetical protein C9I91_04970 [Photobacterium jeanii]